MSLIAHSVAPAKPTQWRDGDLLVVLADEATIERDITTNEPLETSLRLGKPAMFEYCREVRFRHALAARQLGPLVACWIGWVSVIFFYSKQFLLFGRSRAQGTLSKDYLRVFHQAFFSRILHALTTFYFVFTMVMLWRQGPDPWAKPCAFLFGFVGLFVLLISLTMKKPQAFGPPTLETFAHPWAVEYMSVQHYWLSGACEEYLQELPTFSQQVSRWALKDIKDHWRDILLEWSDQQTQKKKPGVDWKHVVGPDQWPDSLRPPAHQKPESWGDGDCLVVARGGYSPRFVSLPMNFEGLEQPIAFDVAPPRGLSAFFYTLSLTLWAPILLLRFVGNDKNKIERVFGTYFSTNAPVYLWAGPMNIDYFRKARLVGLLNLLLAPFLFAGVLTWAVLAQSALVWCLGVPILVSCGALWKSTGKNGVGGYAIHGMLMDERQGFVWFGASDAEVKTLPPWDDRMRTLS